MTKNCFLNAELTPSLILFCLLWFIFVFLWSYIESISGEEEKSAHQDCASPPQIWDDELRVVDIYNIILGWVIEYMNKKYECFSYISSWSLDTVSASSI